MENLQGGTLALEHRYEVESHAGRRGLVNRYLGSQQPFDKSIEILVWEVFDECQPSVALLESLRDRATQSATAFVPGVAQVIDYGDVDEDIPFAVLQRPAGERLSVILEDEGTLSPQATLDLVQAAAKILDAAHRVDLIHGGLCAHHIRVQGQGWSGLTISEFGLTFSIDQVRELDNAIMDFEVVAARTPEAFSSSRAPTPEDDVYALATIAYSALAGVHPYFDDVLDTSEGLLRIQNESPASLASFGLSDAVASVFERAIAREKDARFSTAAEFSDALAVAVNGPEPRPQEPDHEPSEPDEVPEPAVMAFQPSPKATTLGFVILILIVSNLAWLYNGAQEKEIAIKAAPITDGLLIPGLVIDSTPSGAELVVVRGDQEIPLGATPLVVDPALEGDGGMTLKLTSAEYEELSFDLKPAQPGGKITLEMSPRK